MDFTVVISDPQSGKAYQVEVKEPAANRLLGKRIGDRIEGEILGMPGYAVKIASGFYRNAARGLPSTNWLMIVARPASAKIDARTDWVVLIWELPR